MKVRILPKPLSSDYDRLDLRIDYEGQKVKVKVHTLPQLLFSHYGRLDLRIDYEGQKVKVKVKVRTLPQLLFSHYERLDLRIDKGQRVDSFLRQHTIWNRLQMVGNSPTLPRPY